MSKELLMSNRLISFLYPVLGIAAGVSVTLNAKYPHNSLVGHTLPAIGGFLSAWIYFTEVKNGK